MYLEHKKRISPKTQIVATVCIPFRIDDTSGENGKNGYTPIFRKIFRKKSAAKLKWTCKLYSTRCLLAASVGVFRTASQIPGINAASQRNQQQTARTAIIPDWMLAREKPNSEAVPVDFGVAPTTDAAKTGSAPESTPKVGKAASTAREKNSPGPLEQMAPSTCFSSSDRRNFRARESRL